MKIKLVKLYTFEELDDDAKEKARDWYRTCLDEQDYEMVIEDATETAAMFGLDIDDIYYSGFCHQGQGACFVGHYSYKAGALAAVKKEWPKAAKLHEIVERLQLIQRPNFYRLVARTEHGGHYSHSGCMRVDVCIATDYADLDIDHEGLVQCLRDFADWIYSKLDEQNDWLHSDEATDESIICNEYTFTDTGKRED